MLLILIRIQTEIKDALGDLPVLIDFATSDGGKRQRERQDQFSYTAARPDVQRFDTTKGCIPTSILASRWRMT